MRHLIVATLVVLGVLAVLPSAAHAASFDSSPYRPIDLVRAAHDQYGATAELVSTCDHIYCWKAKVGSELKSLDVAAAVTRQYGSSFRLVSIGVYKYDWRAINLGALPASVLPAVVVASDRFFDIQGVRGAIAQFSSVNNTINEWYKLRAGETYKMLTPIVIRSNRTSQQWNDISASTANDTTRYALLDAGISDYQAAVPAPGSNLRAVVAPFTGASADVWLGAASRGRYAVVPPRATSITCPSTGPLDSRCADATYAVGHELGHTFGLGHSCDTYAAPACNNSIMQTKKPWDAVLMSGEAQTLRGLAFFS